MYHLTLVNYALPLRERGFIEKRGNFSSAVSAVRAIYFALNERSSQYDVLVEGVHERNLSSVPFAVSGETLEATGRREQFSYARTVNFGKQIDLPALFYTLDHLVDDEVKAQLFQQGDPLLTNARLQIGSEKPSDSWMIRLFSKAVLYQIGIHAGPEYFGRAVSVQVEIDDAVADDEDRRAIFEVATVLADADFRGSDAYRFYLSAKGSKPLETFEVYHLEGLSRDASELGKRMHDILANDHYRGESFLALSLDNLDQVIPKYLVLVDTLRRRVESMRSSLSLEVARHSFQVEQWSSASPNVEAVLDVKASLDAQVEEKAREVLKKDFAGKAKSPAHEHIFQQLMLGRARMERTLEDLREYREMVGKLEQAGIVASRGFEPETFFAMTAKYGINETAIKALALLEAGEVYDAISA